MKTLNLAFLLFACSLTAALAQGDAEAEASFVAMLKNATLKGTWAPVSGGQLGDEKKNDRYRIVRAEKKDGDHWAIVSLVNHQGQQIEYPIPSIVKFAGDTAVLILNDVETGGGGKWSARVMFHADVYAGSWWESGNREHGGTIAGTITRE